MTILLKLDSFPPSRLAVLHCTLPVQPPIPCGFSLTPVDRTTWKHGSRKRTLLEGKMSFLLSSLYVIVLFIIIYYIYSIYIYNHIYIYIHTYIHMIIYDYHMIILVCFIWNFVGCLVDCFFLRPQWSLLCHGLLLIWTAPGPSKWKATSYTSPLTVLNLGS